MSLKSRNKAMLMASDVHYINDLTVARDNLARQLASVTKERDELRARIDDLEAKQCSCVEETRKTTVKDHIDRDIERASEFCKGMQFYGKPLDTTDCNALMVCLWMAHERMQSLQESYESVEEMNRLCDEAMKR